MGLDIWQIDSSQTVLIINGQDRGPVVSNGGWSDFRAFYTTTSYLSQKGPIRRLMVYHDTDISDGFGIDHVLFRECTPETRALYGSTDSQQPEDENDDDNTATITVAAAAAGGAAGAGAFAFLFYYFCTPEWMALILPCAHKAKWSWLRRSKAGGDSAGQAEAGAAPASSVVLNIYSSGYDNKGRVAATLKGIVAHARTAFEEDATSFIDDVSVGDKGKVEPNVDSGDA